MGKQRRKEQKEGYTALDAYTHDDKSRANIPPVGMAQYDTVASPEREYAYDPHLDPALDWAGKTEGTSFTVPTSSIHIHESVKPHKIIRSVLRETVEAEGDQGWLFESDAARAKRRNDAIEFYQHKEKWANRLIAGDSLVVMNSLLEKESMAGQVQTVYFDPPYGIKYGSNFQPFVNKRDVQDKKDDDLSGEPETIKAFRDTWELGIHSYLTYLRDRLLLAHELLSDTGSVFVQISDENVHLVRCLCDEVLGKNNFVRIITFQKTSGQETNVLASTVDFIIWYAKGIEKIKYHQLYQNRERGDASLDRYDMLMFDNKETRRLTPEEIKSGEIPKNSKRYQMAALYSAGATATKQSFEFGGKTYKPRDGTHWKTTVEGLKRLADSNRIEVMGTVIRYRRFVDDFPVIPITDRWESLMLGTQRNYVVETAPKVIQRCLLMTTDPGDLVLDITCGSGTTAYVAEQWGRRWITCDTSRIALTLAKKRLMTAVFPYYKLARPEQGVSGGFVYKTVPHVTLKSIANNEPPAEETLYDRPETDKGKARVAGPFTVEALPAPFSVDVKSLEGLEALAAEAAPEYGAPAFFHENTGRKHEDWMRALEVAGISGKGGEKITFSRVEPLEGITCLHAEAETEEDPPRRAAVCFGSETAPLDFRTAYRALNEAEEIRPKPDYIIFAAFQFDPAAAKYIDDTKWPGVTLLRASMNMDLTTKDLKKKDTGSQSFWLVGQPDVELIPLPEPQPPAAAAGGDRDGARLSRFKVRIRGFDYYDVKEKKLTSGGTEKIALWMLDTDFDGLAVEPKQVFFPKGKNSWDTLEKTLRAEIDPDLIGKYYGVESLPFAAKENTSIAVKIIDDRGIESLKVIKVGKVKPMEDRQGV